jgi:hypothetical protein|tara:strand:- start:21410 stop:21568 length:159 start_codon:yes stop_codon:yes gene_type:complete
MSLIGLFISLSGPLGGIIGLTMIGFSNGLALSLACKQKYKSIPPTVEEDEET